MDAGLERLLTAVFVTADDLLPGTLPVGSQTPRSSRCVSRRRSGGSASDRRLLALARRCLVHLFAELPQQSGYVKRRRGLADTLQWLIGVCVSQSPGGRDPAAWARGHHITLLTPQRQD